MGKNVMRMMKWKPTGLALAAIAATAAVALAVPSAMAQRDPAYAAARAAGQIGEQPDGHLGFATAPTPALRALVQALNIKPKPASTTRKRGAKGKRRSVRVDRCGRRERNKKIK